MSEEIGQSTGEHLFGKDWGKLESPTVAIIGVIDDAPGSDHEIRIGLSAKQLVNLGLERTDSHVRDALSLRRDVLRNQEGLVDDAPYPKVRLEYDGKEVLSDVYNAFGKLYLDGPNIRASKKLATELGLEVGSAVNVDTLREASQQE
jgi:hypothetical protein